MKLKQLFLAAVLIAASGVLMGCGEPLPTDPGVTINISNTQTQVQGGGAGAPASPGPGLPGSSDVASMAIFVFGYKCPAGTPEPNHSAGIIPPTCTGADLTATPKKADGTDAVNHGNNITWSVAGSAADVVPGATNALFNREVKVKSPRQRGTVIVTATLIDPNGKPFVASKAITVE